MRYLMTFSYDGSKYNGYQKQPNKNTVQDVLESILTRINSNLDVKISASGRTDSGVHALNQKAHFDLNTELECSKIKDSINKMLPENIYVKSVENKDSDFHARFFVKEKEYIYKINIGEYNPLEYNYVYQYNNYLDVKKMIESTKYFIGEHDFSSYTKSNEEKESFIRHIYDILIKEENNIITITFKGNGFLRYMVRNIVGTIIDVGSGKLEPQIVKEILDAKDRTKAGKTAPPNGLYLSNVIYRD